MSQNADAVSVERVIAAPPQRIFDLLADPAKHAQFDGSDTVRGARPGNPDRLSLGARFAMDMRVGVPYRVTNEVVEFEEGRLIAWRHWAGNVWRYELMPVGDTTLVRETFDASNGKATRLLRFAKTMQRHRSSMESTLERIAWLTERR